MTDQKIQRSFYLVPDDAKWLKIEAATRAMSASELIGELIARARNRAPQPVIRPHQADLAR